MIDLTLVVVRPTIIDIFRHSTLDQELAGRLSRASEDASWTTRTCSSRELCDLNKQELEHVTLLVVNPLECRRTSGNKRAFISALASAHKRIVASAEPVESPWYADQFSLPVRFDAVFDIGFVSRSNKHRFSSVPYHFVFNGPTKDEKRTIAELSTSQRRPLRWALVGHPTAGRLALATRLVEEFDAGGFVFLPGKPNRPDPDRVPQRPRTRRPRLALHEKISPTGLAAVLSRTKYYVWTSAYSSAHYESMRFIAALRAGAMPCKIADGGASQEFSQIPGIFSSFQSFCATADKEGAQAMYRLAKSFYLSKGLLATHLKEALELV